MTPPETVEVASAGFLLANQPPDPVIVGMLGTRGLDLSGHRSRVLTPEMVRTADLVVCMTSAHVRRIAAMEPDAWWRSGTALELAEYARVSPRFIDEPLREWSARVLRARTFTTYPTSSRYDIDDPTGRSRRRYRKMLEQLDGSLEDVASLVGHVRANVPLFS